MEQRSSTRMSISRQPLGDATKRVNNAAVANVGRQHQQHQVDDIDYVPLKSKKTAQGHSAPLIAAKRLSAERYGGHARAAAAEVAAPISPLPSAPVQDPYDTADSRRVSQFSTVSSNASSTRQLKTRIGPWELGKTLGKGATARVRLGRHCTTHQFVAIKILSKSTAHIGQAGSLANLDTIDYRRPTTSADGGLRRMPIAIEREIAILKLIQHPNIIELVDIWENRSEIYMVTEYIEKGDMFAFINWRGCLGEEEAIFYFRQVMRALDYCHTFGICHRDLKFENILLKANGQVKIADFGMAALQQGPSHHLRTACGSPHYAAPELLRHQKYKGSAIDIWSMGVILFAMLAGRLPFDEPDVNSMLGKAKRGVYEIPQHLSREAKDLIRRILVVQPTHRITMKQMWRHEVIKKYAYTDEVQTWNTKPPNLAHLENPEPIPDGGIDLQILRQLKALWHSFTETELAEKLYERTINDQKLFYRLLYNHRETRLENYNNDIPISKSDFHHLKPPNWKKRISTCEFTQAGRKGHPRSVSRFTVISNVPEVDEVGTVRSYDPYKASQMLQPCMSQVSHAKITVHRNNAEPSVRRAPSAISRSYRSYTSIDGSFRERSRTSHRVTTTGQLRSPRGSMSSIRSHQSTPRVRVNPRAKRSVDFSNVRNKDRRHRRNRDTYQGAPASIAGESTATSQGPPSPSRMSKAKSHRATGSQSMIDIGKPREDSFIWNEELQQLNHRIARDCDEAFQSSLIMSESAPGCESRETSPFSLSLGTATLPKFPETPTSASSAHQADTRPWDTRPLPPIPSQEFPTPDSNMTYGEDIEPVFQVQSTYDVRAAPGLGPTAERRIVSEPVYSQFSRDTRPLPPISENTPTTSRDSTGKYRLFPETPTAIENKGLDYLAKASNTIRVVTSPAGLGSEEQVMIPEPLNVRKVSRPPLTTANTMPAPLALKAQTTRGAQQKGTDDDRRNSDSSLAAKKRVSLWFKRSSREDMNTSSFVNVMDKSTQPIDARPDEISSHSQRPTSQVSTGSSTSQPAKKKNFNLSFWKSTKNEPKMSLADSDFEDMPNAEDELPPLRHKASKYEHSIAGSAGPSGYRDDAVGTRKIEVEQNWLARLFRVKPATRYLCFGITKRRARQEIAILLKDWRKYGIKNVEVDKERNIVFARVGAKNYLNLKEVSFAVELMTVIEHGKRNQLAIARFTQEKGAASSFHKVVDEMNSQFSSRALLVTDQQKSRMMIKTLNS
ncbi:hypothetical protein B0T17DRAFT_496622 [Bombardia bombarda]|uniref:non-specific serine/threonine protein kinase n=1 Tax=Bombardia bombarda TaxID=252184 RepID=A0AA39WI45_9PEZI|nr:hypothetical protein B0T17DRAFT_496622 [Bombardia bombarda]